MLLACVLSLLPLPPSPAQGTGDAQARRNRVLAMIVEYGQANYDEQAHLVRDHSAQLAIAEGSIEYAAALLAADQQRERAAAVIEAVLATQATSPKAGQPGAFPWRPGEAPSDAATAEAAPWLAHIQQHFRDKLPAETQTHLAASLGPALAAVSRLPDERANTSGYLRKLAAQATLSTALGTSGPKGDWAGELADWAKLTEDKGIIEFNSPSFYPRDVAALQWIWLVAQDPRVKGKAAEALEYFCRDVALHYHPKAGRTAGPGVRVLDRDYLGMGAGRFLLYGLFGQPDLPAAPPFAMFATVAGFVPNQETVQTAAQLDAPRLVRTRTVDRTTTTYLHPLYSLGTMGGPLTPGCAPVALIYPQRDASSGYCTIRPVPARIASVQKDGKALIDLDFDQIGKAPNRVQVQVDVHLGPKSSFGKVLVNETAYYDAAERKDVPYPVAIDSQASVITEREGVFTAVTVIAAGPIEPKSWDLSGKPGMLEWVKPLPTAEDELVLHLCGRQDDRRQPVRDNYRVAFAIEMAATDAYPTVDEFAQAVFKARIRKSVSTKRVKVGEREVNPQRPKGFMEPTERANYIYEVRMVQELRYQSGNDVLELTEDLQKNQIIAQTIDGQDLKWDFLYRSPSLNHMPGDPLGSVLRPPPPPPPTPPPPPPAPEGKSKKHPKGKK